MDFIELAIALEKEGQIRKALDIIYSEFDGLLKNNEWDILASIADYVLVNADSHVKLAIVTLTYKDKVKIPAYDKIIGKLKETCGQDVVQGLE